MEEIGILSQTPKKKFNFSDIINRKDVEVSKDKLFVPEIKPVKKYRRKDNPKRFFYPKEWMSFLNVIKNDEHKFWFEILLHTGARVNEARGIQVKDVDFERECIFLRKTKGGSKKNRTIQISSYLKSRIIHHIKTKNLGKLDYLFKSSSPKCKNVPSTQFLDKVIKIYCERAKIEDYKEFSCHNLRKTLENWGCAIDTNILSIQAHMGHTLDVASAHYVSTNLFSQDDKSLIKFILDNLWNK